MIQFFFLLSIFFPVVLCWKIIFICPKEHYNNSHWLMMKDFLKGDLINSHSFQADGLSNRSTDANNSTVKIHHLEANPLLLAGVPDSSSGTGESEKRFPLFKPLCLVLWKKIFKWQQEPVPLFRVIMPVIMTQELVSQLIWIVSFGAVLEEEHLEAQCLQHQLVHKWSPLFQWSHEFSEEHIPAVWQTEKDGLRE